MSIPYWREKQYTDDGCSIYECLNCYETWESRTAPWWSPDGSKPDSSSRAWNYCPVCGCKWLGQKMPVEKPKYYRYHSTNNKTGRLYPCKFRIMQVCTDGKYVSRDVEHGPVEDPVYALKLLRSCTEKQKEKEQFLDCFTYEIERV